MEVQRFWWNLISGQRVLWPMPGVEIVPVRRPNRGIFRLGLGKIAFGPVKFKHVIEDRTCFFGILAGMCIILILIPGPCHIILILLANRAISTIKQIVILQRMTDGRFVGFFRKTHVILFL